MCGGITSLLGSGRNISTAVQSIRVGQSRSHLIVCVHSLHSPTRRGRAELNRLAVILQEGAEMNPGDERPIISITTHRLRISWQTKQGLEGCEKPLLDDSLPARISRAHQL